MRLLTLGTKTPEVEFHDVDEIPVRVTWVEPWDGAHEALDVLDCAAPATHDMAVVVPDTALVAGRAPRRLDAS